MPSSFSYYDRLSLAKTIPMTKEILLLLRNEKAPSVLRTLVKNPSISEELQNLTLFSVSSPLSFYLIGNYLLTQTVQQNITKTKNQDFCSQLAVNPFITVSTQNELLQLKTSWITQLLATNHALAPKFQAQLLKSNNAVLAQFLAQNPALTEKLQLQIIASGNRALLFWLTRNVSLTEKAQLRLLKINDPPVKFSMATSSNLKFKPAIELYFDENQQLRQHLRQSNRKLYNKINKLERQSLKDHHLLFVGFSTTNIRLPLLKNIISAQLLS